MAITLTIAGASKKWRAGSLQVSKTANGHATATFDVRSNDATYRPALDATVVIADGATTLFGGIISQVGEAGVLGDNTGAYDAITLGVTAVDYSAYVDKRVVITTIPAGNTKAALTQLVSEDLDEFGVAVHASQVDGPDLPYMEYGGVPLGDVLNKIAVLTAGDGEPFVWKIDSDKKLRMFQPSTQAAPFDLSGSVLTDVVSDIEVEEIRDKSYANKVTFRIPATATAPDIWIYAANATEISNHGTTDYFEVLHDMPTEADAQVLADAEVARRSTPKKVVKYKTFASGLEVGQQQSITYAARNLSGETGVITSLVESDYGARARKMLRTVTLTIDDSQTNLGRDWRDTYKLWAKDSDGGGGATQIPGQASSTVFAAAPPNRSVQFNDGGVFGGNAGFLFYKDEHSVVLGTDSSITAVSHDSCFVCGHDCHIEDP